MEMRRVQGMYGGVYSYILIIDSEIAESSRCEAIYLDSGSLPDVSSLR